MIAGHLGDRIGRKRTLVATLLVMGVATTLIGVLPTTESIGVAAPILLVWGGPALLAVEHSPEGRRLLRRFPQLGVPAGLLLVSTGAFALVATLPEYQLLSWDGGCASALELITMPPAGQLSDRIGRRPVVVAGSALTAAAAFPLFWLLDTRDATAIIVAMVVTIPVVHALVFTPLAAGVRYSGVSIGFQLGAVVAGAPTPLLAGALLTWAGGAPWPVALMVVVAGVVALACALAARETARVRLDRAAPDQYTLAT